MKVEKAIEQQGQIASTTWYEQDPFWQLINQSQGQAAKISVNVGRSVEYGAVKASFVVSIDCPQNTPAMDKAAELAFKKALEYTNDAMTHLAPELEPIPLPK
jgi:hypothetical protein